jgi:hypothetical protein
LSREIKDTEKLVIMLLFCGGGDQLCPSMVDHVEDLRETGSGLWAQHRAQPAGNAPLGSVLKVR